MCDVSDEGIDGGPIETFEHAAIAINALVIQGQIKAAGQEGQMLLDHLGRLVETHEGYMRQGVSLAG